MQLLGNSNPNKRHLESHAFIYSGENTLRETMEDMLDKGGLRLPWSFAGIEESAGYCGVTPVA